MNRKSCLPLLLLSCLALAASDAAAAAPKKNDKESAEEVKPTGVNKQKFEAYLKDRLAKISLHHKQRMDYFAKEAETWNSFWTKVKDERRVFEIRMTRQTLDLFESLASLNKSDHPATISDFEKMQGNVVKSFEQQQKSKMAEFFSAREERWRDFAAEQERERSEFLAEATSDWQQSKTKLKNPSSAAAEEAEEEAAPKAPRPKSASKPAPDNGGWH